MQRIHNIFNLTLIGTFFAHVFCCGLPTLVSVLSLLSSLGLMVSMPTGLIALHDQIHDYEIQMMIFSGALIIFGWTLHEVSRRIDCHDTGCGHPPCTPKKKRSTKLLMVATALLAINVSVYFGTSHGDEGCAICKEHEQKNHAH